MLKVLQRVFSFSDWNRSHPRDAPPGDMLDASFDAQNAVISELASLLESVRRSDGALQNGIVTKDSLDPSTYGDLRHEMRIAGAENLQKIEIAVKAAEDAVIIAKTIEKAVENSRNSVSADAESVSAAKKAQIGLISQGIAEFRALKAEIDAKVVSLLEVEQYSGESEAWAYSSQAWAEHMPDKIPANILAEMGVSGDHWSSRWWANYCDQIIAEFEVDTAEIVLAAERAEAAAAEAEADAAAAAGSASSASASAVTAAGSATNADTSADAADTSAANAQSAADTAASSALAAEDLYDQFDDRYLGSKATDPTLDNDGNALLTGALYWSSVSNVMRVFNGTTWQSISAGGGGGASAAIDVSFAPAGTIASTNVQAALQELDGDVVALAAATDARLDPVEAAVVSLDSRTDALEAYDITLDGRLDALEAGGGLVAWDNITGKPISYPPSVHSHAIPDVVGLQSALDGKASTVHTHTTSQITGLDTSLALKANTTYVDAQDALKVAKAGDTMTGNLSISPPSGNALINLIKAASGSATYLSSRLGANLRWVLWLGDAVAESGANAGSDFGIDRYDDAGVKLSQPFSINRATGIVQMPLGATTLTPPAGDNDTSVATTAWVAARGAVASISDTVPVSPVHGQLWWQSSTGQLYIWYNDGDTSQWVQVNTVGA